MDEEAHNERLAAELQALEEDMARKLAELQQELTGRAAPKATATTRASAAQTEENLPKMVKMKPRGGGGGGGGGGRRGDLGILLLYTVISVHGHL